MNSANLSQRVAAEILPLLPAHSSILIGLSGGVDSVVLLHLLHKLSLRYSWQLSALHVHHGISQNADKWAGFCVDLCARLHVTLHVEKVDVTPLLQHGIEAAARKLRHAAFAEQSCDFVALAHHADDQAETLLLQLLRGAGIRGASAMPQHLSRRGSAAVIRPLLHVSRADILAYAATHQLQWMEDESNADDGYPRNYLRHRVLPILEERFPAYRSTLSRSAEHFAEASHLLDELAEQDAAGAISGRTLSVSTLQGLPRARAKNLLRYFLHGAGMLMPQAVQLDDMLKQLCFARDDANVCIAYGGTEVHRYRGKVYVFEEQAEFDNKLSLSWQGEAMLLWPALGTGLDFRQVRGQGISLAKLQRAPVSVRLRHGGETLCIHQGKGSRTLKNLFQERHVPPWYRDRLPLLYSGDELVCVPGVAVASAYQANHDEDAVLVELRPALEGNS